MYTLTIIKGLLTRKWIHESMIAHGYFLNKYPTFEIQYFGSIVAYLRSIHSNVGSKVSVGSTFDCLRSSLCLVYRLPSRFRERERDRGSTGDPFVNHDLKVHHLDNWLLLNHSNKSRCSCHRLCHLSMQQMDKLIPTKLNGKRQLHAVLEKHRLAVTQWCLLVLCPMAPDWSSIVQLFICLFVYYFDWLIIHSCYVSKYNYCQSTLDD